MVERWRLCGRSAQESSVTFLVYMVFMLSTMYLVGMHVPSYWNAFSLLEGMYLIGMRVPYEY